MRRTPIFRRPPARFAVQPQNEVRLVLHLSPAVGIKHLFARGRENMRNAVLVPEDFGFRGRETRQSKEREDQEFFHSFVPKGFRI